MSGEEVEEQLLPSIGAVEVGAMGAVFEKMHIDLAAFGGQ